jgi:hypothetical protein
MKHKLEHFVLLCAGDEFAGAVLSILYDLALYYAPVSRDFSVEFLDLRSKVKGPYQHSAIDLFYIFNGLRSTYGVLAFKTDHEITLENDDGVICPGAVFCIVYTQLIDARIRQLPEEISRVNAHNKRALKLGLPGTLTIEKWVRNLNRFQWKCAYCEGSYEVVEHIIPLNYSDSGTTPTNCVPACAKCNATKGPYHPAKLPNPTKAKIGEAVERVQSTMIYFNRPPKPLPPVRRLPNWTTARLSGQLDAPPVFYPDAEPKKPASIAESMGIKKDLAAMFERMRG